MDLYEIERVYTHRGEDRTTHHVEADGKREAEQILDHLEREGEKDALGEEIESMAGEPLHVHVTKDTFAQVSETGGKEDRNVE